MTRVKAQQGGPGIAISGYGHAEDFERSRRAGFTERYVKPINIDELKAALRSLRSAT